MSAADRTTQTADAGERAIRQAFRYAPGTTHHRGCDSHIGEPCDCYFAEQAEAEAALDLLVAEVARLEAALAQACTSLAWIRPDLTRDDTTIGFQAQLWHDALMAGWSGIEGFDPGRRAGSGGAEEQTP